jgi:phosphoribosyl-dephospho-CoA transferase
VGEAAIPRWARHDLIWIGRDCWANILDSRPDIARHSLACEWSFRGRPLIIRRATPSDEATRVPFGLPLPPAQGRHRICGALDPASIVAKKPPPRLVDLLAGIPNAWRETADRLLDLDSGVRTYGSVAWEYLTQLPYISATSDLDLLWRHEDPDETEHCLAEIAMIELDAPMRIDGEVINAAGVGVHWRELASGTPTVVAKRMDRASLMSRAAFLRSEIPC